MQFFKKVRYVFKAVPPKKGMTFLFAFASSLGYIIMVFFPFAASQIVKYATEGIPEQAYAYTFLLLASYILYEFIWYLNYLFYSKLQVYYSSYLYQTFYDKIASSSRSFSQKIDKGKMLGLTGDDIPSFCLYLDSLVNYVSAFFMLGLGVFFIFNVHFVLSIVVVISCFLYILYVNKVTDKFSHYLREEKKHNDAINNIYVEELNGLKEIKTLPIGERLEKNLNTKLKRHSRSYFHKRKYYEKNENLSRLFPFYTKVLLYILLLFFMVKMNFKIEIVILIIGYFDQIIEALDEMLASYKEMEEYNVSIERVREVLEYQDEIPQLFGKYEGDMIYGSISFKDVTYEWDSKKILDHVNIEIKPSTLTVFVGKSGSGKTTLFDLLLRFYPLTSGQIDLDGRNIYEYSDSIYASNITMVKQNPFLYNMSIDQNLRLVNSSKKRRVEVCEEVGIHPFIMSLKRGYGTILRQNARNLSGGQKQLLSIARALLTDAEILLMDDITSSLDPNTTMRIVELLQRLKMDHTLLVITNREDVMAIADQIIYLEDGKAKKYKSLEVFKEKTGYESGDASI